MRKLVGSFSLAAIIIVIILDLWKSSPQVSQLDEEILDPVAKTHRGPKTFKIKSQNLRSPASLKFGQKELVLTESHREVAIEKEPEFSPVQGEKIAAGLGGMDMVGDAGEARVFSPFPTRFEGEHQTRNISKTKSTSAQTLVQRFSNQGHFSANKNNLAPTPTPQTTASSQQTGSSNSRRTDLSCSASLGDGSYSSSRLVSISCSSSAEIRYCVQQGSCCDPATGSLYTGSFMLGQFSGDYCLSFSGASGETGLVSNTQEHNYEFSKEVPHLAVEYARRYWQTGQLEARLSFVSNNFGKPQFEGGIINLLTHDPSPSGLNMSCQQIVENYTSLNLPSPILVLAGRELASLNPSTQLNAWLSSSQLNYGPNYVTTYIKDLNYLDDDVACTTASLVLEDFEYFTAETMGTVATPGADSFLLGGLSAYGHFEEDVDLNRSPAGDMIDDRQQQELRSGMLGIFF